MLIVKDNYKGNEVNYYVEKEYDPVAQKNIWTKRRNDGFLFKNNWAFLIHGINMTQIVGRDYVSGAMENTTATLHQDGAYNKMPGSLSTETLGKRYSA